MDETEAKFKKIEQRLLKYQQMEMTQKIKQRKLETRKKIEWGGLVVKSKMHLYSKEMILGVLVDFEKKINSNISLHDYFEKIGKKAFATE